MGDDERMPADVLAAIIEQVGRPIFVKDRSFRFVLVNQALCAMVGYRREQMLGKTDYDLFPKTEADFFRDKDRELVARGDAITIEQEPITDAQGAVHILSTTKAALRDETGEIAFLVGIINDITQLKQAEEALRRANEQLEQRVVERTAELSRAQEALVRRERLAMLGQLAGGLAHQLRNPLGAIANASSLCEKSALSAPQRMALDVIREEVRRADRTIADLLDYARIRPPERREVALADVVEAALGQERIGDGVEVAVRMAGTPTAFVDFVQVETALGNVIRNAVEAMPSGGRLTIEGSNDGDRARLVVRDSGPGVPAPQRPSLFDPLVTTKPHGVGLGLSTARNLLENQGGTIQYTASEEQAGAEFTLVLPARAPSG